jgi:hypothetical protein
LLNAHVRDWLAVSGAVAAPEPTPSPAPTVVPTTTPVPTPDPVAPTTVRISSGCSTTACSFRVTLGSAGLVQARVTVSSGVARRLRLRTTTLVNARQMFNTGSYTIRLRLPRGLGRRLRSSWPRSFPARLTVTAGADFATRSQVVRVR